MKQAIIKQIGEKPLENEEYPKLINHQAYLNCKQEAQLYKDRIVFGGNGNDDFDIVSVFENIQSEEVEKENDKGKDKKNKFNHIFKIFLNSCYISSILGKASIYYIIAVIDYALVDHCEKVLIEEEKDKILNNYEILISILSISGSVFGGILSIIVGGYEEIKSCIVVAISSTVTILATFCLFYSNSYFTIYVSEK